jgi:hypothetical protein
MHGKHCKSYIGVFLKIEDCEAAAGGGGGGWRKSSYIRVNMVYYNTTGIHNLCSSYYMPQYVIIIASQNGHRLMFGASLATTNEICINERSK